MFVALKLNTKVMNNLRHSPLFPDGFDDAYELNGPTISRGHLQGPVPTLVTLFSFLIAL